TGSFLPCSGDADIVADQPAGPVHAIFGGVPRPTPRGVLDSSPYAYLEAVSLVLAQRPGGHPRLVSREARSHRQSAAVSRYLPRSVRADRSRRGRRRTRACHGALGHAWTAAVWRPAGHKHPQPEQPALARMAGPEPPLRRPGDIVLRVRGHQAAQDPDMVRTERGPAPVRLRGPMDALARRARPQERAG